jgi:hypothetical protein
MKQATDDSLDRTPQADAPGALATAGAWLAAARARLRESFWLQEAARASTALTPAQRSAMRGQVAFARRRWHVARNLTEPAHVPVALALYREAVRGLVQAFLIAGDERAPGIDAEGTADESADGMASILGRLDERWRTRGLTAPAAFARVTPLLLARDPAQIDRLPREEAANRVDDFDVVCRFIDGLLELRAPSEIARARRIRQLAGSATALGLIAALAFALFAPKNVARGKPATSSSVALGTTPAGAVDGSTSGIFDFHSALENAPWLSIDLGAAYAIDRIDVYGRGDGHTSQSIPLALEASDGGATFAPIAVRSEPFSAAAPWIITFRDTPLVTRFIRLRAQRNAYLVLGEVEAFGHKAK